MTSSRLARLFAELLGTFVLTAVALSVSKTYGTPLFTSLSIAAALTVLFHYFAPLSGAHFNPAITVGLLSVRKIGFMKALAYLLMQATGAIVALRLFEWLSPERQLAVANMEFDWKVFIAEFIGAAIFAMAYASVVYRKLQNGYASATVGLGFFVSALAVAVIIVNRQIVSGIINPAIALGLGYEINSESYLAYFFGPVIGAIVGFIVYKAIFAGEMSELPVDKQAKTTQQVGTLKPAPKKVVATKKANSAKKASSRKKKS